MEFRESVGSVGPMPDFGLFEASRLACPVLPQYHPKQLMELLGFGKLRRVKAILSHLVRCLSGTENIKVINQTLYIESLSLKLISFSPKLLLFSRNVLIHDVFYLQIL